MLHCHTFPLHRPAQLRDVLNRVPLERMEKLTIQRDRGCEPEWTVTLHHHVLTHSEVHRILMHLEEGADLVPFLESFHTP